MLEESKELGHSECKEMLSIINWMKIYNKKTTKAISLVNMKRRNVEESSVLIQVMIVNEY